MRVFLKEMGEKGRERVRERKREGRRKFYQNGRRRNDWSSPGVAYHAMTIY